MKWSSDKLNVSSNSVLQQVGINSLTNYHVRNNNFKKYQFIFHALIDCPPDHGEASDSGDMFQNDPGAFRDVIVHPGIRQKKILRINVRKQTETIKTGLNENSQELENMFDIISFRPS